MASCSILLSDDPVLCSICLDVFTEPVSTPCGHNYCKAWDIASLCQCPLCKETFDTRPELRVNTAFRDLVEHLKRMKVTDEEVSPKVKLGKMLADIDQMVKTRSMKVQQIKRSVEIGKGDAEREISDSVEVFTALVSSVKRSQAELIRAIDETQKAAEKQANGFIKDLEQEITELKRRSTELEQLSQSQDLLHVLQGFLSLSTLPYTKDWSQINVQNGVSVGTARRAVSQLEEALTMDIQKLCEAELKRIHQYAVDVSLDPDTAQPDLVLSEDGKQVRYGGDLDTWKSLPDNPERFDRCPDVLGKQRFSSGRFYYEVQVEGKIERDLGVVRKSIERKGRIPANAGNGYWIIRLRNGHEYKAAAVPPVLLHLRKKPQKVGVFVDYEEGQVSFYDVEARSHIYSFTGCTFTENLCPFFSPSLNDGGTNSAPLIITPVTPTA